MTARVGDALSHTNFGAGRAPFPAREFSRDELPAEAVADIRGSTAIPFNCAEATPRHTRSGFDTMIS